MGSPGEGQCRGGPPPARACRAAGPPSPPPNLLLPTAHTLPITPPTPAQLCPQRGRGDLPRRRHAPPLRRGASGAGAEGWWRGALLAIPSLRCVQDGDPACLATLTCRPLPTTPALYLPPRSACWSAPTSRSPQPCWPWRRSSRRGCAALPALLCSRAGPATVSLLPLPCSATQAPHHRPLAHPMHPPPQAAPLSPDNILLREGTYRAIGECFPHLRTKVGATRSRGAARAGTAGPCAAAVPAE